MLPGYRRRILIEPAAGHVTAELEDDYHRMLVTLRHENGLVTGVTSFMKRSPWTSCPGAIAQLEQTFTGQPLAAFAARGEKTRNCTHLYDLAQFAAAHANADSPVAYDIHVCDPDLGLRVASLDRNGKRLFDWTLDANGFVAPHEIAGKSVYDINGWIATLDSPDREAARILRWASMVANGRQMDIPAHSLADRFPLGTCFTFQPDVAANSRRRPDADVDLSAPGMEPMADRAGSFKFSLPDAQYR
ncbi:hypothetical protein [Sphingobium tyrosinilyticum]|uniref:DUF2889 domain-containing protein n=1 Tax=Sphingobium tyrosinilyticum TaxID=2715436 RepID=A0ABV9F2F5_9SPHN